MAGFPYIPWRGLLPKLVCGLRSQATRSYLVYTLTPIPSGIYVAILKYILIHIINPHYNGHIQQYIHPAIQYISIINTYRLVHPLIRAPETRLNHYLVARPGATVDGAKYITRSPRRLAHPAAVARHYNIRSRHNVALKPNHTERVRSLHYPHPPSTNML